MAALLVPDVLMQVAAISSPWRRDRYKPPTVQLIHNF